MIQRTLKMKPTMTTKFTNELKQALILHERLLARETINDWIKFQLEKGLQKLDIDATPYFEEVDNSYFLGKI